MTWPTDDVVATGVLNTVSDRLDGEPRVWDYARALGRDDFYTVLNDADGVAAAYFESLAQGPHSVWDDYDRPGQCVDRIESAFLTWRRYDDEYERLPPPAPLRSQRRMTPEGELRLLGTDVIQQDGSYMILALLSDGSEKVPLGAPARDSRTRARDDGRLVVIHEGEPVWRGDSFPAFDVSEETLAKDSPGEQHKVLCGPTPLPADHGDRRDFGYTHWLRVTYWHEGVHTAQATGAWLISPGWKWADYFYHPRSGWVLGAN